MIPLTRLSGSVFAINSDLIERIDSTPDTVITLIGGTKYVVVETLAEVVATVRRHRAEVLGLSNAFQHLVESVGAADHSGRTGSGGPGATRRPALQVVSLDGGARRPGAPEVSL